MDQTDLAYPNLFYHFDHYPERPSSLENTLFDASQDFLLKTCSTSMLLAQAVCSLFHLQHRIGRKQANESKL